MLPRSEKTSPENSLETVLLHLKTMSPEERSEILLGYFVRLIASMDRTTLLAFRSVCAASLPMAKETLLEVIDGHLALRQINATADTAQPAREI